MPALSITTVEGLMGLWSELNRQLTHDRGGALSSVGHLERLVGRTRGRRVRQRVPPTVDDLRLTLV
jgi:hypothetical protein